MPVIEDREIDLSHTFDNVDSKISDIPVEQPSMVSKKTLRLIVLGGVLLVLAIVQIYLYFYNRLPDQKNKVQFPIPIPKVQKNIK